VEYLKVLEKSQSVQDLMVLTTVDSSDFGDLDSLPHMGLGDSFAISSKEVVLPPPPPPQTSENKDEPENNASLLSNASSIGVTEKDPNNTPASFNSSTTSSRTGIASISQPNLSNTYHSPPTESEENKSSQNPSSSPVEVTSNGNNNKPNPLTFLNVPELSLLPPTPGTTPNKTGIDINVIQPTPSPGPGGASNNDVLLAMDGNNPAVPSTPTNEDPPAAKKKLKFVFSPVRDCNGNGNPFLRRNTSTPKSATSPLPRDELMNITNNGDDGDVFENDSSFGNGDTEINTSGPISPIKKLRGISPGEL
jgi:hypothetical protein